jgi:hypothetical protein
MRHTATRTAALHMGHMEGKREQQRTFAFKVKHERGGDRILVGKDGLELGERSNPFR